MDRTGGETHQLTPVSRTDHLRDDLTEDEYQHRHAGGHQTEPFVTEHFGSLHTHTGSTDRVGDGVQG